MAKKEYFSPVLLAGEVSDGGNIGITGSQEGALGGGNTDFSDFWSWWNSDDVQENIDSVYPGFNPSDESTWPEWFNINDEETWWGLFD